MYYVVSNFLKNVGFFPPPPPLLHLDGWSAFLGLGFHLTDVKSSDITYVEEDAASKCDRLGREKRKRLCQYLKKKKKIRLVHN